MGYSDFTGNYLTYMLINNKCFPQITLEPDGQIPNGQIIFRIHKEHFQTDKEHSQRISTFAIPMDDKTFPTDKIIPTGQKHSHRIKTIRTDKNIPTD